MSEGEEKRPTFKRRPMGGDDPSIAERAAQELEDLKSDKQWTGASPHVAALAETGPIKAGFSGRRATPKTEREAEALARVQAMVSKSMRDDFLVATRRAGVTAQQVIADFVRKYVEKHAGRG